MGRPERLELTREEVDRVTDLYLAESADLHAYARSLLGVRWFGAQDLVQTTFHDLIRAWDKVGLLTADQQCAWLRRVLRNKAVDDHRKWCRVDSTPDPPVPRRHQADPGELVGLAAALEACWVVISHMSEVKQKVAFLDWGLSWPTKLIAERLGITESRVRAHRKDMRARLRAEVGHLVPFIDDEEGADDGS